MCHSKRLRRLLPLLCLVSALTPEETPTQGRIKWRYATPGAYFAGRPAAAKDGTVYAVNDRGALHAVRPDGKRKWVVSGVGSYRGVVNVDAKGIIYTANASGVVALNPSGTVKWTYRFTKRAFYVMGPNVGPDGNVYAIAVDGQGVVSLTPAGKLRWATPEPYSRPVIREHGLVFGPGPGGKGLQVYFQANGHLARVDASNGKLIVMSGSTEGVHTEPAVGPSGNVYASVSRDLKCFAPDGKLKWSYGYVPRNNMSAPTVDAKGTAYTVQNTSYLRALRPSDGKSQWMYTDYSGLRFPTVDPTNRLILVAGTARSGRHFMRAVSLNGKLLWQVDLPQDSRGRVFPMSKPRFTSDGKTAYFGAMQDNVTCYLYALDTSAQPRADVWTWGRGCPSATNVTPTIGFTGRPVIGSTMTVNLSDARTWANTIHVVGLQQTYVDFKWLGAPGCTAYVRPDLLLSFKTDIAGRVASPMRIPNMRSLLGVHLFHQFAVADSVNRLGVIATAGGGSVIGL